MNVEKSEEVPFIMSDERGNSAVVPPMEKQPNCPSHQTCKGPLSKLKLRNPVSRDLGRLLKLTDDLVCVGNHE